MNKSRKRVEQDYARNAIADGNTKAGKYEAKMAVKEAAGESPAKMYDKKKGSPAHNQNKGYESVGQERKNLMQDNPIASHAGGSWLSKHSIAAGSPLHKGGSYKGSPAHQQKVYSDRLNKKGETQMGVINKADDAAKVAVDAYNNNDSKKASKGLFDAATKANERTTFVRDSIRGANVKMDGLISKIKAGDY